jgi:uncharacterized membrane protein YccC
MKVLTFLCSRSRPLSTASPLSTPPSQRLARDVLALVREGEFSRAMSRADAADLAAAVESTIGCIQTLHPPDDHALPAEDPLRAQDLARMARRSSRVLTSHARPSTPSSTAGSRARRPLTTLVGDTSTWPGRTPVRLFVATGPPPWRPGRLRPGPWR